MDHAEGIHFQGADVSRGSVINILLSNIAAGGDVFHIVLWAVITVILIGIIVYLLRKGRREKAGE